MAADQQSTRSSSSTLFADAACRQKGVDARRDLVRRLVERKVPGKEGSYLPQTTSVGGRRVRRYFCQRGYEATLIR